MDEVYDQYQPDNGALIEQALDYMERVESNSVQTEGDILIIGNSFARDMYHLLYYAYPSIRNNLNYQSLTSLNQFIPRINSLANVDRLIISQRYFSGDLSALNEILRQDQLKNVEIAIILNPIEFPEISTKTLMDGIVSQMDCDLSELQCRVSTSQKVNEQYTQFINRGKSERQIVEKVNEALVRISQSSENIRLYDRTDIFCSKGACKITDDTLFKAFFDYGHVTVAGIAKFGELIERTKWMATFVESNNE